MKTDEIRTYIEHKFDKISDLIEQTKLPSLTLALHDAKQKLKSPLKLAVVGKTKAGKSTLMNALLKISILPTGESITTYNVNVLQHKDKSPNGKEMVIAHLKDGSTIETTLKDLSELVDCRKPDPRGLRKNIKWADVYLDNPALVDMSIIDTPGGDSWLKDDSANTKELFNDKNTRPDLIVFVVRKEFGYHDVESAREYLAQINGGQHRTSGLNVVAAYSCCDQLVSSNLDGTNWSNDYRAEGQRIIENNRTKSAEFRTSFSKCFPIAALFALASNAITDEDFCILRKLSCSNRWEDFCSYYTLNDYTKIHERDPELCSLLGTELSRLSMLTRIGLEPMRYAVWWCRKYPDGNIDSLKHTLDEYSNVPALRSYVLDEHFKKLSLFYKATSVIPILKREIDSEYTKCVDPTIRKNISNIMQVCQSIEKEIYGQYGFLSVMRDYYDSLPYFEEEWAKALDTMLLCISETPDAEQSQQLRNYWSEKQKYYSIIHNDLALEATKKLLVSLHNIKG